MKTFALGFVIALIAVPAFAADAPMAGNWKCMLKIDGGGMPDTPAQLEMKQEGAELSGKGSTAQGSAPLKGTFDDPGFKFVAQAGESPWNFEGKLVDKKLSGTWGIPAMAIKGTFTCDKPEVAAGPLTALWKCATKMEGQPPSEFTLDLTQANEDVTGFGANVQGKVPVKGTFKDGKFKLKSDAGHEFEGELKEGKISGNLKIPNVDVKIPFEGSKS
jgi:hypothetical protein